MQMLFKFKGLLLKPKPNFCFEFFFEFFNIHINHLALHSMINMVLKWHHKNISNKIIVFIKFWWSPDVFFGSFYYDYIPFIFAPTLCELTKNIIRWNTLK